MIERGYEGRAFHDGYGGELGVEEVIVLSGLDDLTLGMIAGGLFKLELKFFCWFIH